MSSRGCARPARSPSTRSGALTSTEAAASSAAHACKRRRSGSRSSIATRRRARTRSALIVAGKTPRPPSSHYARRSASRRERCGDRSTCAISTAARTASEEWEIQALWNPYYDIQRLGFFLTAAPRHADMLLVTGPVTTAMREPLERTWRGYARAQGAGRGRHRRLLRRPLVRRGAGRRRRRRGAGGRRVRARVAARADRDHARPAARHRPAYSPARSRHDRGVRASRWALLALAPLLTARVGARRRALRGRGLRAAGDRRRHAPRWTGRGPCSSSAAGSASVTARCAPTGSPGSSSR